MSETRIRTRNKDIIYVLEIVLDICSRLVQLQRKWNTEYLWFKIPSEADYHSTNRPFSAALLQCIYCSILQKEDSQNFPEASTKIILLVTDAEKLRAEPYKVVQHINVSSVCYDGLKEEHGNFLEELLKRVDESFLESEKADLLRDKLLWFLDNRQKLEQSNTPFPSYGMMDNYLQSYYRLLAFAILNEQELRVLGSDVLHRLLLLDCDEQAVSLLSPIAMNRLRRMYQGIEKFYQKLLVMKNENAVVELFYKSVIEQKILQSFRWFANSDDGDLEHIAAAPYTDEADGRARDLVLRLTRTNIHQYNSYEGIGELRTAEKILYEMEKCSDILENPPEQFRVAILGDVSRKPMEELDVYLCGVLRQKKSGYQPKLVFDIYTKNDVGKPSRETTAEMNYYSNLDEIFTSRERLGQLLQEHEVIFIMDCVKLYYDVEYVPEMSSEYLKQRFAFGGALDNATEDKIDICCPNLLDKLYELMTIYDRRGELGRFSKRANDALLKFCEEQIHLTDTNYRALYVYVSDINAFNNIYCNDRYYVRTERYNQKEIGIIRYVNHQSENLSFPACPTNGQKMLCFNVWQIVKHISLDKRKAVIKAVLDEIGDPSGETVSDFDLHCMHIGIDYSDWPRRLALHYAMVDDSTQCARTDAVTQETFLKIFVTKVVEPIFNATRDELFQNYIWKTIYSLLYGAAKNVEEMVLIHLLKDKAAIVGRARIADENKPESVADNINRDYKYSIKRFVAMIISRFDISASGALDQMWAAHVINKCDEAVSSEEKLFNKVKRACEGIGYVDSYLYRNCINVK